jgi:beta-phosphoglucomutase-like phosphatase (HAD superfamily)
MEHFLGRAVEPSEIDGYHARLRAEADRRGVQPYPGIPEALEALARSAALGAFTNADLGNVDVLLGAAGLRDRFAVVVGADEVAPNFKPAPDGLLLACERLQVPAERTPTSAIRHRTARRRTTPEPWRSLRDGGT